MILVMNHYLRHELWIVLDPGRENVTFPIHFLFNSVKMTLVVD